MMRSDAPIILPVRHGRTPRLGPVAVMTATEGDLDLLRAAMKLPDSRRLYLSRLYYDKTDPRSGCLVGPILGAPYAAMILETLRVWGATKLVFVGWCGSISPTLVIGDVVLPCAAFIDEGTSLHYGQDIGGKVMVDADMRALAGKALKATQIDFHTGDVWTTDGIFRETPAKIRAFQEKGAVAVEMELSALLSVAAFYGLYLAGLLTVSDELFSGQWRPGFADANFTRTRERLVQSVAALAGELGST